MDPLVAGDLRIDVAEAEQLLLNWTGRSTDRQPNKAILPFVASVFGTAKAQAKSVEMHFERLDHFNSATITAIVQIIHEAKAREVPLTIVYAGALKWQKLSFDALRVFTQGNRLEIRAV
jgi:hypothetical protein